MNKEELIAKVETAFKEYCHGTGCYYCKYANKNGEIGCRGLFIINYFIEHGYIN